MRIRPVKHTTRSSNQKLITDYKMAPIANARCRLSASGQQSVHSAYGRTAHRADLAVRPSQLAACQQVRPPHRRAVRTTTRIFCTKKLKHGIHLHQQCGRSKVANAMHYTLKNSMFIYCRKFRNIHTTIIQCSQHISLDLYSTFLLHMKQCSIYKSKVINDDFRCL